MRNNIKESILEILNSDLYKLLNPDELYSLLFGNDEKMLKPFFEILSSMEENYEIFVTKKGKISLPDKNRYVKGTYSASGGAFGFVRTDFGDYFIPPSQTLTAMNGDTVMIEKAKKRYRYYQENDEAKIISVISRAVKTFVGVVQNVERRKKSPFSYVIPDDTYIKGSFIVKGTDSVSEFYDGDKVLCEITKYPKYSDDSCYVRIINNFGNCKTIESNYNAILCDHNIPIEFDDIVVKEAEKVSCEIIKPENRLDLRKENIFSMDSEDAKDLDDAVSVRKDGNYFWLGVHIADVSHYVKHNSYIDKEAMKRGTSIYFVNRVIPMLPKILSNGVCSLNGGVDRYTLSAFMKIDKGGNVVDFSIHNSIINSKVRGVYSEINDVLGKGQNSSFFDKYSSVFDDLLIMKDLYEILLRKSDERGVIEFESDEIKFVLDEKSYPVDIVKRERGLSERIIEQFMLCANNSVASFLRANKLPCVYRIHEKPSEDKMSDFREFAKNIGLDISPIMNTDEITSKSLLLVLEDARRKGKESIVSNVMLRSLMKAKYSPVPGYHFGLALENYCHFTSPIRRYPDLSVHRILKKTILENDGAKTVRSLSHFSKISAEKSSENELKALYTERDIEELYKVKFMESKIGQVLPAVISSVTSFGIFAKTDFYCEGLVPIDNLGYDCYYDKTNYLIKTRKRIYRLGQTIKIKVLSCDVSTRKITFGIV